jgi:tetratricopeptide (TPR) repeat protein
MKYEDYTASTQAAAELFEKGEHARALDMFERLLMTDISPIDKAMMCHNVAMALDRLGRLQEALHAYDRAIAFERPFSRCDSVERKAAFLAEKGDTAASLALYEELLGRPYATEGEKYRYRANVATLRQRLG